MNISKRKKFALDYQGKGCCNRGWRASNSEGPAGRSIFQPGKEALSSKDDHCIEQKLGGNCSLKNTLCAILVESLVGVSIVLAGSTCHSTNLGNLGYFHTKIANKTPKALF